MPATLLMKDYYPEYTKTSKKKNNNTNKTKNSTNKWANELEQMLLRRTNDQSLHEMQIKTTLRIHLIPVKWQS